MIKRLKKRYFFILGFLGMVVVSYAQDKGAPFIYDDHAKRDPFWPLVNSSGVIMNYYKDLFTTDMNLEGIIVDNSGNNVAIINGVIVTIGQPISQYVVSEIHSDHVTLKKGEESF